MRRNESSTRQHDWATVCELVELVAENVREPAHFLLCNPYDHPRPKAPATPKWQDFYPGLGQVYDHLAKGGLIGAVPATLDGGYTVVDVDKGQPARMWLDFHPYFMVQSSGPGRAHLWYKDPGGNRPNAKWEYEGCSGEIRSANGYVILWPGAAHNLLYGPYDDHMASVVTTVTFGEILPQILPNKGPLPIQALEDPDRYKPVQLQTGGPGWVDVTRNRTISNARQALERQQQFNPDDYHDWITVGLCLHQAAVDGEIDNGAAFYLWCDWAAKSPKFRLKDHERRWQASFGQYTGQRVTLGTLFKFGGL